MSGLSIGHYLVLSSMLFATGILAVTLRRNAIGILIVIVFGVLLTDRVPEEFRVTKARNYLPALLAAGLVFAALAGAAMSAKWPKLVQGQLPEAKTTVEAIGRSLLTDYLIPFEFASVLLLVVLVGAARLARGGARP